MNEGKPDKLLSVQNIVKHFKVDAGSFSRRKLDLKAVNGVSFDLCRGETLGLVGESGCGKTTVGRLVLRLYETDQGRILYKSTDIAGLKERDLRAIRREIQIVFQDTWASLNPRMLVKDIITEGALELGVCSRKNKIAYARELLEQVGLPSAAADLYPHEFSGGQRQRIGIARALSVKPSLVICDEPVSALDVSIQAQILNLLLILQQEFSLTYLFIAHDINVVQYLSDRIAVMYLGKIVELAETAAIIGSPRHPYTVSLLSAVPVADPEYTRQEIVLEGDVPSPIHPPCGCTFHPRCPNRLPVCETVFPPYVPVAENHYLACYNPIPA